MCREYQGKGIAYKMALMAIYVNLNRYFKVNQTL